MFIETNILREQLFSLRLAQISCEPYIRCSLENLPCTLLNSCSISSRVLPLVSGTRRSTKKRLNSRGLAGFRRRLSRGVWLLPSLCRGLSRFGRWFDDRWQFPLGRFCRAMMAMVQRLDACGFFFHPQLSVAISLALAF
jgi:hypothetical protein